MTNYDKFTMKENEIVTEQLKLKELTKTEDVFKMYLDVLYQVKKIEALKKELRELFELDMNAEYEPSLAEQILGIELQTDGM